MKKFAEKLQKILNIRNYSTTTPINGIDYKGIVTISAITNNDGVIVGIKIYHVGTNKHEETLCYHFMDTGGVTSIHASNSTYASHTSEVTKATSKMCILEGRGFSDDMNELVNFKKILKKNEKTGDITSKLYFKDKDNNYKMHSKTIAKLIK